MSYVIYNIETTKFFRILRKRCWENAKYKSLAAAKAAVTRHKIDMSKHAIADEKTFHDKIEKWETVYSLMNKQPIRQRVNTPLCCDPSSETYWSM